MNKKNELFLSVVLPLTERQDGINNFIGQLTVELNKLVHHWEVILVSSWSHAHRLETTLMEYPNLRLIKVAKEDSMEVFAIAGIENAIGDFIITLDIDTDPVEIVEEFFKGALLGSDIVLGISKQNKISLLEKLLKKSFYWYVRKFIKIDLEQNITFARLFSRSAANALCLVQEKHLQWRCLHEIIGHKTSTVSYVRIENRKHSLRYKIKEAIRIITQNTPHPLRIISLFSFAIAGVNLLYVFYVISIFVLKEKVPEGWTTISLQVSGLFFLVLILLSIISEYIGQMLSLMFKKPSYYIQEEKTSNIFLDSNQKNITNNSDSISINH